MACWCSHQNLTVTTSVMRLLYSQCVCVCTAFRWSKHGLNSLHKQKIDSSNCLVYPYASPRVTDMVSVCMNFFSEWAKNLVKKTLTPCAEKIVFMWNGPCIYGYSVMQIYWLRCLFKVFVVGNKKTSGTTRDKMSITRSSSPLIRFGEVWKLLRLVLVPCVFVCLCLGSLS